MAKTPFPFKPSKPTKSSTTSDVQGVALVGTADVLASYSDVFVVTNEAQTGMASIYFYQRRFDDREVVLGTTEAGLKAPTAKCITRIVMSSPGMDVLLGALAKNRGFTLTPIKEEEE